MTTPRASRRPRAAGRYAVVPLLLAGVVALPVLFGAVYSALALVGLAGAGSSIGGVAGGLAGGVASGLQLARAQAVFTDPVTWRGVGWSLYVAAASTALATAGAALVALLFPGQQLGDRSARALAALPLPVPHLVAAATALFILGQSGLLARILHAVGLVALPADMPPLVYDRAGAALIASLAWKEFPFLAVVAFSLRGTQANAFDEAARTLGASRAATAWRVHWPLLWRGLLPAVIATFVFAFGSYESAVLLAPVNPAPLPILTMERFADPDLARRGEAYGLALVALLIAGVAVVVHEWTRARWSRS